MFKTTSSRRSPIIKRTHSEVMSPPKSYSGGSASRANSPGQLLTHVHDRLIEESDRKDAIANELSALKRRIEEFSIRLDFILKCWSHNWRIHESIP
jgi:hypothetical protein